MTSESSHPDLDSDDEFYDALDLLIHARRRLPLATQTEDIVAWNTQQVRSHFVHHVIPLLSDCADEQADHDLVGVDAHDDDEDDDEDVMNSDTSRKRMRKGDYYERHMIIVMSSIRTLEAALRLYSHGLRMLIKGFSRTVYEDDDTEDMLVDPEVLATRFRHDIHALVGNSASEGLMKSLRIVLARLVGTILGMPSEEDNKDANSPGTVRPAPPSDDDLKALAARQRLHELVEQLHDVGLAGERFQVLFAKIMDWMMSAFVSGAYAGLWTAPSETPALSFSETISRATNSSTTSHCISSLSDWVENHFARLSIEVLSRISPVSSSSSPDPVMTLSDANTYQSLALGRLAALRIAELYDIALAWPSSKGALDDLRATITTTARRLQLTTSFSRVLQSRLLHHGRSTLEILQTYIAIIRTLHALDHSKVLLGHVEPSLRLYLCQREDAVRIVVTGMLASPEEIRAARLAKDQRQQQQHQGLEGSNRDVKGKQTGRRGGFRTPVTPSVPVMTPTANPRRLRRDSTPEPLIDETQAATTGPAKLVELAVILNETSRNRQARAAAAATPGADDEELDWNDMSWVPDPVDAGANYKRPKSEDVIGTLISALGSEDVFIKEFASVLADRLLGDPTRFDQELRVLDLLKRRFGEAALQNCDVMIRDVQDSRRVDAAIQKGETMERQERPQQRGGQAAGAGAGMFTPTGPAGGGMRHQQHQNQPSVAAAAAEKTEYHARILSRLFWPALEREHFLLPQPIVEQQARYEQGYEGLKSNRKLTWLNQLGQAHVELELADRDISVDCTTVEATVIYAFQPAPGGGEDQPARRSIDELYMELQMDEDLIAAALSFWESKQVLRRVPHESGVYVVVEKLADLEHVAEEEEEEEGKAEDTAAAAAAAAEPAIKGGMSAKEMERRAMYWQYVRGMLTNARASMPLAQMAMMMKMLIADGFPWSNEELQEFLAEKIAEGELEVVGGKYKLVKK